MGSRFYDLRLNERVRDPNSGEPVRVYECFEKDGALHFRCTICAVTVFGKRNLDSHIEGKKHKANMAEFEMGK